MKKGGITLDLFLATLHFISNFGKSLFWLPRNISILDIDIWQSGTTRSIQDGVVVKGLAPRRLDPVKYHLNPNTDLNELEKGMPWRTIQDEFGKFKWVDHAGRIYHGTPFSVEPDVTSKHILTASMMHTSYSLSGIERQARCDMSIRLPGQ